MSKAKTVIVTGATSGVGLELVTLLKQQGYNPILTSRNAEKVKEKSAALDVPGYVLDVADTASIPAVMEQITKENGPVLGLVNNAGIWLEGEFLSNNPEDIQKVVNCNMMGTMMATHAVLPDLVERGTGFIFNVVSTGALYTRKGISVYGATKWAIRGFTGCLEVEYAPKGVRVMGFYPGKISSDMYTTAGVPRDLDIAMTPLQAAEMIMMMITHENMVWSHVSGRSLSDYT